jgi:hypothetical protein
MTLDQNTTVLLSTLLGGLLTLGGSFVANFYTQSASTKSDKQKAIRNMVEQVYKDTKKIEVLYDEYEYILTASIIIFQQDEDNTDPYEAIPLDGKLEKDLDEKIHSIKASLNHIELLVNLYLSPLEQSFTTYQNEINTFIEKLKFPTKVDKDNPKEKLEAISKQFRTSLLSLSKKKGYHYF